jgi:lysophospholipase L1-like esterase
MAPTPMPMISQGLPSFTNDDFFGSFPASYANDATYGGSHMWRCVTTPTGNANDGTLTQAVWWALDLSTVQSSQRQQVLFAWTGDSQTGAYAPDQISNNPNNLAKNYTIESNTASGGGSPPISGWTTLATITGNVLHSRQHLVNMAGANWIRIHITDIHGSAVNNNAAMKVAIHDAHAGASDSWIIFGDSITQRGIMHDEANGFGQIIPKQINALFPTYYPYWENGGEGGWTAADIQSSFSSWLANFPGKYVGLAFGTNDANLGGTYVTNFQSNMQTLITAVLNAGKTPVIPRIPWGGTTNLLANVPTLNTIIDTLITSNPGTLAGPDMYAYFNAHQSEIDPTDHIHPTDPALSTGNGYVDYKAQWVAWAQKNIYTSGDPDTMAFDHFHFAVQA